MPHICGLESFLSSRERIEGYQAAMREVGFTPNMEQGSFDISSGYEIAAPVVTIEGSVDGGLRPLTI